MECGLLEGSAAYDPLGRVIYVVLDCPAGPGGQGGFQVRGAHCTLPIVFV